MHFSHRVLVVNFESRRAPSNSKATSSTRTRFLPLFGAGLSPACETRSSARARESDPANNIDYPMLADPWLMRAIGDERFLKRIAGYPASIIDKTRIRPMPRRRDAKCA